MYKRLIVFLSVISAFLLFAACAAEMSDRVVGRELLPSEPLTGSPLTVSHWENDNFVLELEKDTATIQVTDKSNGFVWSSRPLEPKYEDMSRDWQLFAESLVVIDFINLGAVQTREMYDPSRADSPIYVAIDNGFAVSLHFPRAEIRIRVEVILTETGISASIPDEGIEYFGDNIVSRILLLPFLGAAYQDDIPGYIFLPDGSGALMRFAPARPFSNSWTGRVYGTDRGVVLSPPFALLAGEQMATVPMPQVYLPIFGVVQGENAFAAIIESGDIFCDIEASPAGDRINYFWVAPRFIYHELYWQPTGGGRGFVTPTPSRNIVNARVDYHFLSGEDATHSGMANVYRQILIDRGMLSQQSSTYGNIPIKLDAVMAEQQSAFIGTNTLVMTQFADIERWIDEFKADGLDNITIAMIGAERGGISGRTTGALNIERQIGGERGLRQLYEHATTAGVRLVMQTDIVSGFEHQIPIRRAVYALGGSFLTIEEHRPIYSTLRFMNFDSIINVVEQIETSPSYIRSLSLDNIANSLTSDFNSSQTIFREDALDLTQSILADLNRVTSNLLLESPNAYAIQFAQAIYNVPITNSRQLFLQDVVPFYQMVFGGYIDMFAPIMNYRAHSMTEMLRLIDFNIFPSYVLTEESATLFARSNTVDIFSSRYDDWRNIIVPQYHMVNDVLRNVRGQYIVSRREVADNVFAIRYSGGGHIVVNYSGEPFEYNGVMIESETASFIK